MNIDEAIKELVIEVKRLEERGQEYRADAIKLGIEALKLIIYTRQNSQKPAYKRLLGETEQK